MRKRFDPLPDFPAPRVPRLQVLDAPDSRPGDQGKQDGKQDSTHHVQRKRHIDDGSHVDEHLTLLSPPGVGHRGDVLDLLPLFLGFAGLPGDSGEPCQQYNAARQKSQPIRRPECRFPYRFPYVMTNQISPARTAPFRGQRGRRRTSRRGRGASKGTPLLAAARVPGRAVLPTWVPRVPSVVRPAPPIPGKEAGRDRAKPGPAATGPLLPGCRGKLLRRARVISTGRRYPPGPAGSLRFRRGDGSQEPRGPCFTCRVRRMSVRFGLEERPFSATSGLPGRAWPALPPELGAGGGLVFFLRIR